MDGLVSRGWRISRFGSGWQSRIGFWFVLVPPADGSVALRLVQAHQLQVHLVRRAREKAGTREESGFHGSLEAGEPPSRRPIVVGET